MVNSGNPDVHKAFNSSNHILWATEAVSAVMAWLLEDVIKPHPALGRNGAVCPFLDQATMWGRVSLNVLRIDTVQDVGRLRTAAAGWLSRIRSAADDAGQYESVIFVPVGPDGAALVDSITQVQRELRSTAIHAGCMIGEFFPGHEGPGIHNPDFRPLDSPWPILGIRTMVETDILFLSSPSIPVAERAEYLDVWCSFFGHRTGGRVLDIYQRCRQELGEVWLDIR